MGDMISPLTTNFSLTRGGPFHRLLVRLGCGGDERQMVIRRAIFMALFTWLPLLIFSLVQGLAYGTHVAIPFLLDFSVNVRFLIALPILILAESAIDRKWRTLTLHFLKSGLVRENDLPLFETAIERTSRLRDSILPEAIMLLIAFAPSFFFAETEILMHGYTNWHALVGASGGESLGGWWFKIISMPIFRFLLLRWVWRMFLWSSFLWRVSRIKLFLVATHTDKAGGLGFLSGGQKSFTPIVFAGGAVIAAQGGNAIIHEGRTVSALRGPMIAYGVLAIVLLIVPLLVVTPLLHKVKKEALLQFGALVTRHDQLFDAKWIGGNNPGDEVILGNPDASSLIDLGSSFTVIREMGIVPIDKATLISLAVAAALPVVPLALFVTPADALLRALLKMLV
jgi:hypothetical protein